MSGWIDYMDYYAKGNMFERRFYDVNVSVTNPSGPVYQLNLSGRGKQRSDESISLTMNYNHSNRSAAGLASINTKYLTEYWDYYLDDIFRPWNLKAKNVAVSTMFSYKKGELVLNGRYSVDDGILSHGDLSVKCDMAVEHNINYVKSAPEKCVARIKASIKDISSSSGEHVFLKDARCTAYITHREVFVRGLEGLVLGQPANMGGIFLFKPKELYVHGSLASLYNKLYLKVKSENKAIFGCRAGFGGSWLKAFANVTDLRDMAFEANTECSINLGDVPLLFKSLEKIHLSGNVNFSGYIKGEMDDFSSLNGAATLGANNISMLDVSPVSFNVKADIKKGLLSGDIPRTGFYEGDLYGALKADPARWGAQLNIDRLDLTEFFKNDQKLEGIKGVFDGNLSCVSEWKDIHSASGGGYFKLSDCDMRKTPLFSSAEEGIKGVVNGFIMPNFTKITGNFDIADGYISTQRVLCQSVTMTLNMNGKYSFSGDTTFNVGVRFLSKGLLGAARIILAPQTLGIDLLASTLNIKITGKWPGDLKQQTEIQPMAWMAKVFDPSVKISVYKCTLDKLWNKKQSR
jgi:hypothetical protein